jgi:hypothetical protein
MEVQEIALVDIQDREPYRVLGCHITRLHTSRQHNGVAPHCVVTWRSGRRHVDALTGGQPQFVSPRADSATILALVHER